MSSSQDEADDEDIIEVAIRVVIGILCVLSIFQNMLRLVCGLQGVYGLAIDSWLDIPRVSIHASFVVANQTIGSVPPNSF